MGLEPGNSRSEDLQIFAKICRFFAKNACVLRDFAEFAKICRFFFCENLPPKKRNTVSWQGGWAEAFFGFLDFSENAKTNVMLSFLDF